MNTKHIARAAVVFFLTVTLAEAAPITLGTWTAVPPADADGAPFWDGASFDGAGFGIGFLIAEPGLEYLHDGADGAIAFTFDDAVITPTLIYNITARMGGILGRMPAGAFTYNNGLTVLDSSNDYAQFALFRVLDGSSTRYILGVEDILIVGDPEGPSDIDFNDYVVTFTQQPVPEPATLTLFGVGLLLGVRRWMR